MKLFIQEVDGVRWAFAEISKGSSYLVAVCTAKEAETLSIQEIVDRRDRAIAVNHFENLQNTAKVQ